MSYWQEIHDSPTNHWYWAELGCVIARSIGLFQDPTFSGMPDAKKGLWKRIGWSCMLRDRVLHLGVRMPPKINPAEFHLPLLKESDFDILHFPTGVLEFLNGCDVLADPLLQSRLARTCVEKTKLCVILWQVFNSLYVDSNPKLGETEENTSILLPKTHGVDPGGVSEANNALQAWLREYPSHVQASKMGQPSLERKEKIAAVHSGLVLMFYHAIVCAFCGPQLRVVIPAWMRADKQQAKQRLRHSALMITRQLEEMHSHRLLEYLPSSSVTFLLTASANHLVEYQTSKGDEKQWYLRRFQDCMCYLKVLETVHVYAKYTSIFLHSAAAKAGVHGLSERGFPDSGGTDNAMAGNRQLGSAGSNGADELGGWSLAHMPYQLAEGTTKNAGSVQRLLGPFETTLDLAAIIDAELLYPAAAIDNTPSVDSSSFIPTQNGELPYQYDIAETMLSQALWSGWVDEIDERSSGFPG